MRKLAIAILLLYPFMGHCQPCLSKDEVLFENARLLENLVEDLDNARQSEKLREDLGLTVNLKRATKAESKGKDSYAVEVTKTTLERALRYYNELVDSFPKSKVLFRALNNKGLLEFDLGKDSLAEKTFVAILNSDANDREPEGAGSGLMAEPYANYKNRAAKNLAELSIRHKNYEKALNYLELTKKFPYHHFCGNENAADANYITSLFANCYIGLNNYSQAYKVLLPRIIEDGLADNSIIVELAYKALRVNYSKRELKKAFELAVDNYKPDTSTSKQGRCKDFFIVYLGVKIPFDEMDLLYLGDKYSQKEIDNMVEKELFSSKFYKLLK